MLLYQETTCFAALVALYLHIWDGRTDLSNSRFAFQSDRRGDARPSGQIPPTFLHKQVGGYMGSDNLRLPCVQPPTSSYNLQIAYEQPPTSSCSPWSWVVMTAMAVMVFMLVMVVMVVIVVKVVMVDMVVMGRTDRKDKADI